MTAEEANKYVSQHIDHLDMENGKATITVSMEWLDTVGKALGEASDKASDKEEIIVPEKWKKPTNLIGTEFVMRKQNEIINCLEQIKERVK